MFTVVRWYAHIFTVRPDCLCSLLQVDDLRRRGEAWAQDETVRRDNERMLQAALLVNEDPSESLPPVLMPQ